MRQKLQQFISIVQKDPAVDTVVGFTGGGGQTTGGEVYFSLKPATPPPWSISTLTGSASGYAKSAAKRHRTSRRGRWCPENDLPPTNARLRTR